MNLVPRHLPCKLCTLYPRLLCLEHAPCGTSLATCSVHATESVAETTSAVPQSVTTYLMCNRSVKLQRPPQKCGGSLHTTSSPDQHNQVLHPTPGHTAAQSSSLLRRAPSGNAPPERHQRLQDRQAHHSLTPLPLTYSLFAEREI